MPEINQYLIDKALALTGKTIDDIIHPDTIIIHDEMAGGEIDAYKEYSIDIFLTYLLSPEFIEKYMPLLFPFEIISDYEGYLRHTAKDFGQAIYEFQSGNIEPLTQLLKKI